MLSLFKIFKRIRLQKKKINKVKARQENRKILIKDAIMTHNRQSRLLDNLGEATKAQLREFAMKNVFNIKEKD